MPHADLAGVFVWSELRAGSDASEGVNGTEGRRAMWTYIANIDDAWANLALP
jgi:hypothetical protein